MARTQLITSWAHATAPQPHQIERGIAVKAAEPDEVPAQPFAQFSAPTAHKGTQLPKRRARVPLGAHRSLPGEAQPFGSQR